MDWRGVIAKNKTRTFWVMVVFFLLYTFLGFLLDLIVYADKGFSNPNYHVSLHRIDLVTWRLLTLQIIPYITIGMQLLALVAISWIFIRKGKIMMMGLDYDEVDQTSEQQKYIEVYNLVEEMKIAASLNSMPKVYILKTPQLNAFASGWDESSASITLTEGLINKLPREQLQAVIAHELTHIINKDVRLMLVVTVLSQFMLVIVSIFFRGLLYRSGSRSGSSSSGRGGNQGLIMLVVIVIRIVFPLLTMLLTLYLSRKREFLADAGAVELTRNPQAMAKALVSITEDGQSHIEDYKSYSSHTKHESLRRMSYIVAPEAMGFKALEITSIFSTHPTLKQRLESLGMADMMPIKNTKDDSTETDKPSKN